MGQRLFTVDFVARVESKGLVVCGPLDAHARYPRIGDAVEVRRRDGTRRVTAVTNRPCDPTTGYAEVMLRGVVSTDDIAAGDEVWAWEAQAEPGAVPNRGGIP